MAGYSGRSVVQKLGLKPGFCIFVDGAPAAYEAVVGKLPNDVRIAARLKGPLDVVHVFAKQAATLRKKLPATAMRSRLTAWSGCPGRRNLRALPPM